MQKGFRRILEHVPDANALLASDLVEESAPPAFVDDSYPLDWPGILDRVAGLPRSRHRGGQGLRRRGRRGVVVIVGRDSARGRHDPRPFAAEVPEADALGSATCP